MRFRVYAETVSPAEATTPENLRLLARYGIDLVLAIRPPHVDQIARAVHAAHAAGVPIALWPMIEDARGRWPSARNAEAWITFADDVVARVEKDGANVDEILFDLEPPFGSVRALTPGHFSPAPLMRMASPNHYARGCDALIAHRERLRARGVRVSAAIIPLCVFSTHWERALGTPANALAPDLPSVMAYTTIYEGWSRRVFSRSDALALLAATVRATVKRYGARAGISLGTVGTGAFDDEPIYRSPDELTADAAVAAHEGATSLTLFDLGGILRRGPPSQWLDAFTLGARMAANSRAEWPRVPLVTRRRIKLLVRAIGGRLPLP